ncbi:hypothetical protein [Parafilimonas sp.]|uniref:hypothetical protein n=1 Tax=Parafilimonas sp. TaxID=1969739 RepID=UPI0039E63E8F
MSDLLTMVFFRKYIQKPMHLLGSMGFIMLGFCLMINIYLLCLKFAGENIWGKPLLILGMILLLGGIQLITIGFLAEISIRIYFESGNRKTYQVRRIMHGQNKEKEHIEALL